MSCGNTNCGCTPTRPCGCNDQGLHTPCSCDTPQCPDYSLGIQSCGEVMSDKCIVHDGDGIADFHIETGDSLASILQKIAITINQPDCINGNYDCQSALNFQAVQILPTSIYLKWTLPTGSAPTAIYIDYEKALNANPWSGVVTRTVDLGITAQEATIGPLDPNSYYHIRVVTTDGTHECYSASIKVKTAMLT